jgi:hypothetical protein
MIEANNQISYFCPISSLVNSGAQYLGVMAWFLLLIFEFDIEMVALPKSQINNLEGHLDSVSSVTSILSGLRSKWHPEYPTSFLSLL